VEKKRRPTLVADYRLQQLGDQLIARDASEPAPDVIADPSVITPASNAQMTVAAPTSHDLATEGGETEQGMDTPELIGPPIEPNSDSTAAVEEPKPVEVPTSPEPAAANVASNAPAITPSVAETPPAVPAPAHQQAAPAKSPSPKGYWFLGPFPKFQP
jgi:hypothetical protein